MLVSELFSILARLSEAEKAKECKKIEGSIKNEEVPKSRLVSLDLSQ